MNTKRIVSALLSAAIILGSFSAPASVNPTTIVCEAETAKLSAPKISSKATTINSIKLSWSKVSGAKGYKVYLYDSAKKKYVLKKTVTGTSANISGLKSGVKYKLKVCAYVLNGKTKVNQKSTVISVTTKKLTAPTGIKATTDTDSVTLSWNAVSGASVYRIYSYNSSSKKFAVLESAVRGTSYTNDGLKSNTQYRYKIAALVKNGSSYAVQTKSSEIKATTKSSNSSNATLKTTDFTVTSASGENHKLSEFAGKPIVVNFWATWCPPCVRELPSFNKLAEEYDGKVNFLMVNTEGSSENASVKQFVDSYGYTFPLYFDNSDEAYNAYGNGYIPVTVVINSNGEVIYNDAGGLTEDYLRTLIEKAF